MRVGVQGCLLKKGLWNSERLTHVEVKSKATLRPMASSESLQSRQAMKDCSGRS